MMQNEQALKIKSLSVQGYKSLGKEIQIDLSPLTVLCGVNSSGKSSFFQPFLLLKQTQEATFNPEGILLNGPNIQIFEADKTLCEISKGERCSSLDVGFYLSNGSSIKNSYSKAEGVGLSLVKTQAIIEGQKASITKKAKRIVREKIFKDFFKDGTFNKFLNEDKLEPHIDTQRGFFNLTLRVVNKEKGKRVGFFGGGSYDYTVNTARSFLNFLHVPGIRGNPERNYKFTTAKGRYVGRFEDYTASIVYGWQTSSNALERNKVAALVELLKRLGLTTSIQAKKINDAYVSLEVGALPVAKKSKISPINIADVGFGVSQILPILVALLTATKGQAVYIEQPELHLHPQSQSVLAEILAEFALQDKLVIIETHSSIILRKLQAMVAKKKLLPKDVSFNWFSMDSNGLSFAVKAKVDEKGRYGSWPQDFDDVYLSVESEYISAAAGI